jgi:hypothetical protein
MEILLYLRSVRKRMGRKRPSTNPRLRARELDWSTCEGSRDRGVTAQLPPGAAAGKARIADSHPHALVSRSDRVQMFTQAEVSDPLDMNTRD